MHCIARSRVKGARAPAPARNQAVEGAYSIRGHLPIYLLTLISKNTAALRARSGCSDGAWPRYDDELFLPRVAAEQVVRSRALASGAGSARWRPAHSANTCTPPAGGPSPRVRRLAQASMCTVCGLPAKCTKSTPRSICLVRASRGTRSLEHAQAPTRRSALDTERRPICSSALLIAEIQCVQTPSGEAPARASATCYPMPSVNI